MFSQKVESALRAVVHLADEAPAPRTVEQIAVATRVPQAYLAKVVQELTRAGVVRAQRGIGGGISLLKASADLTLPEVVDAVNAIRRIEECPLGLAAHAVRLCPLQKRLDRALGPAEALAEPSASVPLCDFPGMPPPD